MADEDTFLAFLILLGGICFIGGCSFYSIQWARQEQSETELCEMHRDFHRRNGFTQRCDICSSRALRDLVSKAKS